MILVVDDDEAVLRVMSRMLAGSGYQCATVRSAAEARQALRDAAWDLVLSDMVMPFESGIELLRYVRAEYTQLPIVMVSSVNDMDVAGDALSLGAYGYVTKPFDRSHLLIAVANALQRAALERENAIYRDQLEAMVAERTAALADALESVREREERLQATSGEMVAALTRVIQGRDVETGQHVERMGRYSEVLARHYGLSEEHCALIRLASPMHDLGKVAVPDAILLKPGRVSPQEYEVIKQHPDVGFGILSGSDEPVLVMAAEIARTHHERWDGQGYGRGLLGESIPIEGRIAAVADVFDALVSKRVYKPAFSIDRSLDIMRGYRASYFDPDLVDVLFEHVDEMVNVRADVPDE